jgi:hypothetical protein
MPTAANTTVQGQLRPELGASLQQFDVVAALGGMVGLQILKPKSVPIQNGYIGMRTLEELMKDDVTTERSPGAEYGRSGQKFTNFSFATKEYGHEEVVDDREAKLYQSYLEADIAAAQRIQGILMRRLEKEVCDLLTDTASTFTGALTDASSAAWTTVSTDIIQEVEEAMLDFRTNSGMLPNVMVVGYDRFRAMLRNTGIVDRLKYWGQDPNVGSMMANTDVLAKAVGIDKIVVAGMIRNSALEGQSRSLAQIWDGTKVGFYRAAMTDDIKEPCVGRTFIWTEDGANPDGSVVFESYRSEERRGRVIRGRHESQAKIAYDKLGFVLTGC